MSDFVKYPCKNCPYRSDVKPYLRPERGVELAYLPQNPYNEFFCHKTTRYDDSPEDDDEMGGDMVVDEDSKLCAGFLTLRAQEGEEIPEGFEPAWDVCYVDSWDMIQAYDNE